jgi:tRNA(Ile2) C34 agmatinyltransferase TiaS
MAYEIPSTTIVIEEMPLTYTKNEDGEFVCPHCNIVAKNQNTMHYHLKKHMNDLKYECKECDKSFLQKQSLLVHMRFKHSEKEENAFQCPFECEFTSPVKGNCVIHIIRVHFQDELQQIMFPQADTKTVLCGACNEEFKSNSAFMYHCKRCLDLSDNTEKNMALKEFL